MTTSKRGKLKIFMGYAAGVGKTYKMLEEAHALRAAGVDAVVAYFEPHGRQDTIAKAEGLEIIPRKKIEYRGAVFEEMDTDRILLRRPEICFVDEFPHSNVPGSPRAKRWEDVMVILEAGIDVQTTMNIQHLESLNDQIRHITNITVRETIPDWIVQKADEVVMVDLTPRALLHRLERGVVYEPEQAQRALQNFFREPALVALRELALREAAHEVGQRLTSNESAVSPGDPLQPHPQIQPKILVYLTGDPKTAMVIRRAKRVSDFLGGQCFAVAVQAAGNPSGPATPERGALEKHLTFARNLQIETRILTGDAAPVLVDFARQNGITQIFVTRPQGRARSRLTSNDPVQEIIDLARDIQIVIVSDRDPIARR
jgi:two-component system, OmpR family, sensor histidine kinase KdpD